MNKNQAKISQLLGERSKNSNKLVTKQSRPKRKHAEENHKQQQPIRKVIKLYGRVLKKDNKRLSFMSEEIKSKLLENVDNNNPTNQKYTPIMIKQ